ncbi:MAG: hypothetical protein WAK31_17820 [Chthoniobacterales bacterium]
MPSVTAIYIREALYESAPNQGEGLHNWLPKGARKCRTFGYSQEQAFELIAETVVRRGGKIIPRSIEQATERVYSQPFSTDVRQSARDWPAADLDLIRSITLDKPGEWLEEILELSPVRLPDMPDIQPGTTDTIIHGLYPGEDLLLCLGVNNYSTETYRLSSVKDLHRFRLLVPSPMSKPIGITQDGRESGRCLDNTGQRQYLVTEFDFKEFDDQQRPTKYAPLIADWRSAKMTVQDACAAIILEMRQHGPLTMVVYSGGKSLHAWWWCLGESEEPGSKLHRFMCGAAQRGADTATYTRSQFVRMPGAVRINNGVKQSVHYLDFQYVQKETAPGDQTGSGKLCIK